MVLQIRRDRIKKPSAIEVRPSYYLPWVMLKLRDMNTLVAQSLYSVRDHHSASDRVPSSTSSE
jgi:hypothetical protein